MLQHSSDEDHSTAAPGRHMLEKIIPPELAEQSAAAKTWMKRGIALLSANDMQALPEALRCFDEALALRRLLPVEQNSWCRWLLTAAWMNRGDVLMRLGGPENLAEALRCFDEAVIHLERLPLDLDPQYRGRLVLAWINRALTLRAQASPETLQAAMDALNRAQSVLEEGRPLNLTLQATLMTNRAALMLELPAPQMREAMQMAESVLEMCRQAERANLLAAEMGLKARHVFCHAVALLLSSPPVDTSHADDWILQATDKVEEAMHLTAHWEQRSAPRAFLDLRHELFRYGCTMYLSWQPHFLAEFLLDVLDPERGSPLRAKTDDLCQTGLEALKAAAVELRRRGPLDLGLQGVDRLLEVLESLNAAAERIQILSKQV